MANTGYNLFKVDGSVEHLKGKTNPFPNIRDLCAKFAVAFQIKPEVMQSYYQEQDLAKVDIVATAIIRRSPIVELESAITVLGEYIPVKKIAKTMNDRVCALRSDTPIVFVDWFMPINWEEWSVLQFSESNNLSEVFAEAGEEKKAEALDYYQKGMRLKSGSHPRVCGVNLNNDSIKILTKYAPMDSNASSAFSDYLATLVSTKTVLHEYASHDSAYYGHFKYDVLSEKGYKFLDLVDFSYETQNYEEEYA